ncbi:MAG: hypothetical protein VKJ04_12080 [Vampirovibrionales bacterium]|nr:hypothetical protein [Vampirovibrionales bacterium]
MALNTKQKWLIGCGGCLGVVVLFFALLIGGVAWYHNSSVALVNRVLGKEPAGYTTLMSYETEGSKGKTAFAMLLALTDKKMLLAYQLPENEQLQKALNTPDTSDPQELEKIQQGIEAGMGQDSPATQTSSVRQMTLKSIHTVGESDKTYKAYNILVENSSGKVMPMVALFVPQAKRQILLLSLSDVSIQTSDTQADFSIQYAELTNALKTMLKNMPQ